MNATDVADLLDATADLLLIEGWAHRYSRHASDGLCVLQALAVVCGLDRSQWSWLVSPPAGITTLAVGVAAYRLLCDAVGGVALWNDDPERIEDEVHDLLRGTAKQLRDGD